MPDIAVTRVEETRKTPGERERQGTDPIQKGARNMTRKWGERGTGSKRPKAHATPTFATSQVDDPTGKTKVTILPVRNQGRQHNTEDEKSPYRQDGKISGTRCRRGSNAQSAGKKERQKGRGGPAHSLGRAGLGGGPPSTNPFRGRYPRRTGYRRNSVE